MIGSSLIITFGCFTLADGALKGGDFTERSVCFLWKAPDFCCPCLISARALLIGSRGFLNDSRAFILLVFGDYDRREVGRVWVLLRGAAGALTFSTKATGLACRMIGGGLEVSRATTLCAPEYRLEAPTCEEPSGLLPSFFVIMMLFLSSFCPDTGNFCLYLSGYWISRRE